MPMIFIPLSLKKLPSHGWGLCPLLKGNPVPHPWSGSASAVRTLWAPGTGFSEATFHRGVAVTTEEAVLTHRLPTFRRAARFLPGRGPGLGDPRPALVRTAPYKQSAGSSEYVWDSRYEWELVLSSQIHVLYIKILFHTKYSMTK